MAYGDQEFNHANPI